MKVLSVIGARPQFVKAAVVSNAFVAHNIHEIVINTGQHYDYNMSGQFLSNLNMKQPDFNLNVGSGSHAEMTAAILTGCEKIIIDTKPDFVVVYGDTNSTLAGALAAAKLHIPVAHIEAGIRMLPKTMPEEINRILVDRISSKLFCPTLLALENLKHENITQGVYLSGDVMYDIFLKMKDSFSRNLKQKLMLKRSFVLTTLHRDYNVDNYIKLELILKQLSAISNNFDVVFPIHPRTKKMIQLHSFEKYLGNLIVTEPLSYSELMGLLIDCEFVITDSGGLQKESYFASKRAIVVMPDTGWQELIDFNINILADETNLFEKSLEITKHVHFTPNIYGEGNASLLIAKNLLSL